MQLYYRYFSLNVKGKYQWFTTGRERVESCIAQGLTSKMKGLKVRTTLYFSKFDSDIESLQDGSMTGALTP